MPRKLLIDTNILLDAALAERPERAYALLLMDEFVYSEAEGYITSLSLKDIYYILSKYQDASSARQFVISLMDIFNVVAVDSAICRTATVSNEPDFEDGIVRACAEQVPVDFIITRDSEAFARSPIKKLSARSYLDLFCEVEEVDLPL